MPDICLVYSNCDEVMHCRCYTHAQAYSAEPKAITVRLRAYKSTYEEVSMGSRLTSRHRSG